MIDSGIHKETEDLRHKLIDSDVVAALTAGLSDQSSLVRQSTIGAVGQLANYGKFTDL